MSRRIRWTVSSLFLALGAAASLGAQSPTIVLPQPTGQFGVGTVVWDWPDPSRLDEISPAPNDVREVMAQAWYPSDTPPATAPTNVYSPLDPDLQSGTGWSQPGAPFSSQIDKAPIVAICPGSMLSRTFYTTIAEELASHGYVVLGVDFPYVGFVAYPDGRNISNAFPVPPILRSGPYSGVDQFLETPGALAAGDLRFALKSLQKISDEDPARRLTGKIDWRHLGLFSHSLGSKACGAVAGGDDNDEFHVAGIASMEGTFPIAVRAKGVKAATLLMFGIGLPQPVRDTIRELIPNRRDDVYDLSIPNFLHNNVDELAILFPKQFASVMDPYVGLAETRTILMTFFDQQLKGTGPGTLSLTTQIPGTTLLYYPGPTHGNGHGNDR
jgi:hypothetical protein